MGKGWFSREVIGPMASRLLQTCSRPFEEMTMRCFVRTLKSTAANAMRTQAPELELYTQRRAHGIQTKSTRSLFLQGHRAATCTHAGVAIEDLEAVAWCAHD